MTTHTNTIKPAATPLKAVLLGNAAFSALCAIDLLLFSNELAAFMGITSPAVLLWLGVGLLLFAASVAWDATRTPIAPKKVKLIIWQDWAWVLGSAVIIGTQYFGLTAAGYIIVAAVAAIVGMFAGLQLVFLRKMVAAQR